MFEFSRSVRRQVEFDGRKLVSVEGGGCSKRSNFISFLLFFLSFFRSFVLSFFLSFFPFFFWEGEGGFV